MLFEIILGIYIRGIIIQKSVYSYLLSRKFVYFTD